MLAIAMHMYFAIVVDPGWLVGDNARYLTLMLASRFFIWIPSIALGLYFSYRREYRIHIPSVALIAVILNAYGFIIWAYFLGAEGIEYAESSLIMVTVAAFFAFGIPFHLTLATVFSYTVAFVIVVLLYAANMPAENTSVAFQHVSITRIISTVVGTVLLISVCAYQTECIKTSLLKSRYTISQGRASSLEWLQSMADFLKHELRGKRRTAEFSLELLMAKEASNYNVVRYGERLKRSLIDMDRLIEQTVTAANIEESLLNRNLEKIDLRKHLDLYIKNIERDWKEKDIQFTVHGLVSDAIVFIDSSKLDQMLNNILLNAIDFHKTGTTIQVSLKTTDDNAIISIGNEGPLLPKKINEIFNISYSSRNEDKQTGLNSGFGLFVSRRIAIFNQGAINAHNNDRGTGVIFDIILPLRLDSFWDFGDSV